MREQQVDISVLFDKYLFPCFQIAFEKNGVRAGKQDDVGFSFHAKVLDVRDVLEVSDVRDVHCVQHLQNTHHFYMIEPFCSFASFSSVHVRMPSMILFFRICQEVTSKFFSVRAM